MAASPVRQPSLAVGGTILKASVWNNARHRITGALGRLGSNYVQVLQGPSAALHALLSRLELMSVNRG